MKKFGRSTEHRAMLMRGLVTNLILAESIKTTLPKAKEARKDADKIVTVAKKERSCCARLASRSVPSFTMPYSVPIHMQPWWSSTMKYTCWFCSAATVAPKVSKPSLAGT